MLELLGKGSISLILYCLHHRLLPSNKGCVDMALVSKAGTVEGVDGFQTVKQVFKQITDLK